MFLFSIALFYRCIVVPAFYSHYADVFHARYAVLGFHATHDSIRGYLSSQRGLKESDWHTGTSKVFLRVPAVWHTQRFFIF
jgi:hypothetical protein